MWLYVDFCRALVSNKEREGEILASINPLKAEFLYNFI
jgi:hypothetical protein